MPTAARESLLFQALDDDRRTISQLTSRINALLGLSGEMGSRVVWEGDLLYLTSRMMRAGQLYREPESSRNKDSVPLLPRRQA